MLKAGCAKLSRPTGLQTSERNLQAIDPRFRDTMRLLEGNELNQGSDQLAGKENLLTKYSTD
ncbi:MAG: hypothetical protein ACLQED_07100 [Desulfobaccales bacterium]